MEKVLSELIDWIKNRITSPLLSTFMISWVLVNRKFVYTMLFVDEGFIFQKYGLLKNEYLSHMFYNHELVTKLIWYIHSDIWVNLWATIIKFLMPLLSEIWIDWLSMAIRFLMPLIIVLLIYGVINPFDKCVYERDQKHLWRKKSIQEIEERKFLDIAITNANHRYNLRASKERERLEEAYKALTKKYEEKFTTNFKSVIDYIEDNADKGKIWEQILTDTMMSFFIQQGIIKRWDITNQGGISLTEYWRELLEHRSYFINIT